MNLFQRILKSQGFVSREDLQAAYRRGLRSGLRSFAGARSDRTTADWRGTQTTINQDMRMDLVTLRDRSRDLTKNDSYAKRFINLCRMNVVGPNGFKLQVRAKDPPTKDFPKGKPDYVANAILEREFAIWQKRENCSASGQQSFRAIQDLAIRSLARDGEFLIQKVRSRSFRYGIKLQLLDIDFLDERVNLQLKNGNAVRMGVEFDAWNKPVAYYFKQADPALEYYQSYGISSRRIPAADIYHAFDLDYASQARGFPAMSPTIMRMRMLSGYEHAALVNARISASKMGFFTTPADAAGQEYAGTDTDETGNKIVDVEPGSFEELPPGMALTPWEPKFPDQQHEPFVKSMLRGISSGLNVSYNMLANDLEGVNYSSIRAGLIDERENWMAIQQWFIESLLEPVFGDWLESAMLTGAISLPMSKFEKFNAPVWIGRRWSWVDPEKDVNAQLKSVQAGFTTRTQVIAERGDDREDVDEELAQEKQAAKDLGLDLLVDHVDAKGAATGAAPNTEGQPGGNQ